jgi:hypothetical protein
MRQVPDLSAPATNNAAKSLSRKPGVSSPSKITGLASRREACAGPCYVRVFALRTKE